MQDGERKVSLAVCVERLLGSAGVCPVRDVPCAVGFTLVLVVVVESGSVVGQ